MKHIKLIYCLIFFSLKRILPNHSCLTSQPFNLASWIWSQNIKNDANMEIFATKNITKINKYKKAEQYIFEGTQNRQEHY